MWGSASEALRQAGHNTPQGRDRQSHHQCQRAQKPPWRRHGAILRPIRFRPACVASHCASVVSTTSRSGPTRNMACASAPRQPAAAHHRRTDATGVAAEGSGRSTLSTCAMRFSGMPQASHGRASADTRAHSASRHGSAPSSVRKSAPAYARPDAPRRRADARSAETSSRSPPRPWRRTPPHGRRSKGRGGMVIAEAWEGGRYMAAHMPFLRVRRKFYFTS